MLKVTEIAFSCYPVADMARARRFYEDILGLKPTMVVGGGGGIARTGCEVRPGALAVGAGAQDLTPRSDGCRVGLEVEDFDSAIQHLRDNAVKFRMEPFPTPICRMAFIADPEGNTICI